MRIFRNSFLTLLGLAMASVTFAEGWTPPENPDPQTILNEARADTQAKRYEVALAKYVWFHEHALSVQPSMAGVRLSFALSDWETLGRVYPPALEKLRRTRDALELKAIKGEDIGSGFHDLAALNRTLKEDSRTTDAFRLQDELNPKAATVAFVYVKAALIKDKAYELYAKYIRPKRDFDQMKKLYELNLKMAENPQFGPRIAEHGTKTFRNNSATLVAVLAVNKRDQEAKEFAALAKQVLEDEDFSKEIDAALTGTVPNPWP